MKVVIENTDLELYFDQDEEDSLCKMLETLIRKCGTFSVLTNEYSGYNTHTLVINNSKGEE